MSQGGKFRREQERGQIGGDDLKNVKIRVIEKGVEEKEDGMEEG